MFDSFITDKSKDLLLIVFIALIVIRVGGFSFLFRLTLKILRIDFQSDKLKNHNQNFFDAQMYRFINGINVVCADDGALIEDNIKNGNIRRSSFWLTGYFGPIGHKRLVRVDILFISAIFSLCIAAGVLLLNKSYSNYEKGYVSFNMKDERIYISLEDIYDKVNNKKLYKEDCNSHESTLPKIYSEACSYLVPASKDKRTELINAIADERKDTMIFIFTGLLFIALAAMLFLGFIQFSILNKKICDIKDSLGNNGT